jgi:hypothetical protein
MGSYLALARRRLAERRQQAAALDAAPTYVDSLAAMPKWQAAALPLNSRADCEIRELSERRVEPAERPMVRGHQPEDYAAMHPCAGCGKLLPPTWERCTACATARPCFACGTTRTWQRPGGERVCLVCHPPPPERS